MSGFGWYGAGGPAAERYLVRFVLIVTVAFLVLAYFIFGVVGYTGPPR